MRPLRFILFLLSIGLAISGCGKKFHLQRDVEYQPTIWPDMSNFSEQQLSDPQSEFYSGDLNIRWKHKVSGMPVGPLSIAAGKLIVCTTIGKVYFFDLNDGKYLGKYKAKANVQTGLVVVDSLAYFSLAPTKNRFQCLNLHNRHTIWRTSLKDVTGSPIIINDRLYLASATGWVECRDRMTGEIIWQDSVGAKSLAGPSHNGETVYFPLDDGHLMGFEASTGDMIFKVDLKQPLVSKAVVDDFIFISGVSGILSVLDKDTGDIIWERSFEWPIWNSPAIDENMVFVGDNGGILRALDKENGRTIWTFSADGLILSTPTILGKYLIFASLDRNLYCLDKRTGLLISKWENDHEIRFPAITDGQSIYVAARDGSIYCLGE